MTARADSTNTYPGPVWDVFEDLIVTVSAANLGSAWRERGLFAFRAVVLVAAKSTCPARRPRRHGATVLRILFSRP